MSPRDDKRPAPSIPGESDPLRELRHEVRTPISQIIGYSELLVEEAKDAGVAALVPDLEKITVAGRRLLVLVETVFEHGSFKALSSERPVSPEREPGLDSSQTPSTTPMSAELHGRLLVVDDNLENRDMLARRLGRAGYEITQAADGQTALGLLHDRPFDLVLLDVMMPGLSGTDVLKRLRCERSAAELPVIMATARSASEDVVEALAVGANDYVTKPLDFPVVLARVETQLALKRNRDEVCRLADQLAVHNEFVKKVFGRYLTDEVVASLLASPEALNIGGECRRATVMLTDLRGFTALVSRLDPEQVIHLLNNYLEEMIEIIMKHSGTIDEFLGDSILVLFGAPVERSDDARRAVACAVEMQLAMPKVNEKNRRDGLPEVEMGVSLNTGELMVGNIGSQQRTKYGVVGTPINVAARVEGCTVGGQVLIAESTFRDAGNGVLVGATQMVSGKGLDTPVRVYDLKGIGGEYQLRLPEDDDPLNELVKPIPVIFSRVHDKAFAQDARRTGALVDLSRRRATLEADCELQVLSDLSLTILGSDGSVLPGTIYAKVMDRDGTRLTVQFTSIAPEADSVLSAARENTRTH